MMFSHQRVIGCRRVGSGLDLSQTKLNTVSLFLVVIKSTLHVSKDELLDWIQSFSDFTLHVNHIRFFFP